MRPLRAFVTHDRRRERGSMLVEAIVSVGVVVAFLAGVFSFLGSSVGMISTTTDRSDLDARTARTIRRVVNDLHLASASSVSPVGVPGTSSNFIELRRIATFDGGEAFLGSTTRYEFQRDPRDPDDGVDNDNDGLIDEGRVVSIVNFGEANAITTILAEGVAELLGGELPNGIDDNGNGLIDEPGLVFEMDSPQVTVRLTLESLGPRNRVLQRTIESTVVPRN